ncbi:MAG: hypothetical protein IJL94_03160 [Erysipelotrichaceae bacterium]|nr:hypothetical protein [Erysipelotrichaceae bacterium]
MEKIKTFSEVLMYLKDQEIVISGNRTSFYLQNGQITAHNNGTRFTLTVEDFKELYGKEPFFLYKPDDSNVNAEKDEEYYSWKASGVN